LYNYIFYHFIPGKYFFITYLLYQSSCYDFDILQAHREVFEYLIEDFKTYKPLLSSIKNEYEMMLAFQRQQIRELEPLKVRQIFSFVS